MSGEQVIKYLLCCIGKKSGRIINKKDKFPTLIPHSYEELSIEILQMLSEVLSNSSPIDLATKAKSTLNKFAGECFHFF